MCRNKSTPLIEKIAEIIADEVDVPNSVTYLNQMPIFEWYVVRCGFKNEHNKKDMCL